MSLISNTTPVLFFSACLTLIVGLPRVPLPRTTVTPFFHPLLSIPFAIHYHLPRNQSTGVTGRSLFDTPRQIPANGRHSCQGRGAGLIEDSIMYCPSPPRVALVHELATPGEGTLSPRKTLIGSVHAFDRAALIIIFFDRLLSPRVPRGLRCI